jgi:hypothetical protein
MLELLKRADTPGHPTVGEWTRTHDEEAFERIRCPACEWQPAPTDRWSCMAEDTPEPPFSWCGTVWNTFSTSGRCPGCQHQWQWTSCLHCHQWSLHEDWYERA